MKAGRRQIGKECFVPVRTELRHVNLMTFYVCVDEGKPIKVEREKVPLKGIFKLDYRWVEIIDVHETAGGLQLQVTEIEPPRGH